MTATVDLTPQEIDLKLYSGDGARIRLIVKDTDDNPVPLTGTIKSQIRKKRGVDTAPEAEFSVDMTDAATGVVILSLTGAQMQALAPTKKFSGSWDVQWTASGQEPKSICQGKVECDLDVSR